MAENERKNEIIGANYAWNSRSPVNLCKPWLNLGATSGSLYTYFDKGCFGIWLFKRRIQCNALLEWPPNNGFQRPKHDSQSNLSWKRCISLQPYSLWKSENLHASRAVHSGGAKGAVAPARKTKCFFSNIVSDFAGLFLVAILVRNLTKTEFAPADKKS